jgi:hypothetical protein
VALRPLVKRCGPCRGARRHDGTLLSPEARSGRTRPLAAGSILRGAG